MSLDPLAPAAALPPAIATSTLTLPDGSVIATTRTRQGAITAVTTTPPARQTPPPGIDTTA
ncbi:hypothetical protein [Acidocella sp.]|uniref:hypothetical protein n=1 Tax=Acidocella sp. TaxID=50710 RepID=UPI002630E1F3|nr:hypothetical protein [Acidocella sp.]